MRNGIFERGDLVETGYWPMEIDHLEPTPLLIVGVEDHPQGMGQIVSLHNPEGGSPLRLASYFLTLVNDGGPDGDAERHPVG